MLDYKWDGCGSGGNLALINFTLMLINNYF